MRRTLLGVENMLQAIAVPEPFSLELAGDVDGVTLMARCLDEQVVRQQISTHYPQARIHEVTHRRTTRCASTRTSGRGR